MRSLAAVLCVLACTASAGAETFEQRWTATVEALFVRDTFDETTARLGFAPVNAMTEASTVKSSDAKADRLVTASIGNTGLRVRADRGNRASGYRRCTGYSWCTTSCSRAAKGSRQAAWCASMKRRSGAG
jgi:hypothetical protein